MDEPRAPNIPKDKVQKDILPLYLSSLSSSFSLSSLPSERDQNFLIFNNEGEKYLLKISNIKEEREVLEMQNSLMNHLKKEINSLQNIIQSKLGEDIIYFIHENNKLLTYVEGTLFAHTLPHNSLLLFSLGSYLGKMSKALSSFENSSANRVLKWDLKESLWARSYVDYIKDKERKELVVSHFNRFEKEVLPILSTLRKSVIHNDANDYNIIVGPKNAPQKQVVAIIDYGDVVYSHTICELAIALAYSILDQADPLQAAVDVVRGYNNQFSLLEKEIEILFPLLCTRLSVSVTNSAYQQTIEPENKYLVISEAPAWKCLLQLQNYHPNFVHYMFRKACNIKPYCVSSEKVTKWLKENKNDFAPILGYSMTESNTMILDYSIGSLELGNISDLSNVETLTHLTLNQMSKKDVGVGRYNEVRAIYNTDAYTSEGGNERRTVHIGMDLMVDSGHPIYAPFAGVVHSFQDNNHLLDYGPTIILKHEVHNKEGETIQFYTLYGHLTRESLEGLEVGKFIEAKSLFCRVGSPPINGNWPPHLHFQIMCDMLGKFGDFPGVAFPSQREVWLSICPDPNIVLNIPQHLFPKPELSGYEIIEMRDKHISKNFSLSYKNPLYIVRGYMQYLYDENGQVYLDGVNNVSHVGHCHPHVVKAAQKQMFVLNTNTRYLHPNIVNYAKRLCATLPEPLSVCFFVCSGSEANELALRIARTHTKQKDIIVIDGAYHGNTASLIEASPYKFDGKGGSGKQEHVHTVIMPDTYRGPHKKDDTDAGKKYADDVLKVIQNTEKSGKKIAAFMCEAIQGCGGQLVLPPNYLKEAFSHIRKAGGLCISDEVQTGFGRVGSHFWAFETQGVCPDIVTLGKPIGNGHPIGAVITTPEIASSFCNGMEYFNTFGGNPVSCATGMAVLDVIENENLQKNSLEVGNYLLQELGKLKEKHPIIGDVRGLGLFVGIELVLNKETLEPAADQATYIANRMKERGVLISTDGPLHNVLKLKPPLVFSSKNVDYLIFSLDVILNEDFVKL